MTKFNYIQNSFTSGELSEKIAARSDTKDFTNGAELIKNAIVMPEGGARRRPGFRFLSDDVDVATIDQLAPFYEDDLNTYLIGLGSKLTAWDTNGVKFAVTEVDPFPDKVKYHYVQTGDLMIITSVDGDMKPYVIRRTGVATFEGVSWFNIAAASQATAVAEALRMPFQPTNITPTTIEVTGGPTYTFTAAPTAIFTADDVGRHIRIEDGSFSRIYRITGYPGGASSTTVTGVGLLDPSTISPGTDNWALGSWSDTEGPFSLTIHEQRMVFGGCPAEKDTVHLSATANLFHMMQNRVTQATTLRSLLGFTGSPTDADPFSFIIASREVNEIQWLNSGRQLLIGTTGVEYVASGSQGDAISRSSIIVRSQSHNGSNDVQSLLMDGNAYFIGRGVKVISLSFNFNSDQYKADDLTLLNDRITRLGFDKALGYYESDIDIMTYVPSRKALFLKTTDGNAQSTGFIGLTVNNDLKVSAFHRHVVADGSSLIKTFVSAPNRRNTGDHLYMVVDHGNGATLEVMTMDYELDDLGDALSALSSKDEYHNFLDSQAIASHVSGSTFDGLDHLNGMTVGVIVNGKVQPDEVVNGSGEITIDAAFGASDIVFAGLKYETKIKTFPLEAGQDFGSAQGMRKRIDRAHIRFYRSASCKFSTDDSSFESVEFPIGNMGDPLPLFTGDKRVDITGSPEDDPRIIIKTDAPLPLTVLGIVLRGVSYD